MTASQRAATQSNALRAGGLVFLGGSLGTALRALVGLTLPVGWVALPTLVVNVVGAFAIGVLYESLALRDGRRSWRLFLGTGVLGGFTTYSALAVAVVTHGAQGWTSGLVSVIAGLVACWIGAAVTAAARAHGTRKSSGAER